ncbi:MAG TPA: VWA domain-containing protein, partial [Candidatus Binatia bacterium]|nr:VWA domain-containing protein [Candidatus Binatia bacterium]
GRGQAEVRGRYDNAPFSLVIPLDLSAAAARPLLTKFWAAERVRDWEAAAVTGRRAERLKGRIVELAVKHGIVSRYTSFLVVEQRTGERRSSSQPATRVIPVTLPAGWAMFGVQKVVGVRQMSMVMSLRAGPPSRSVFRRMSAPPQEPEFLQEAPSHQPERLSEETAGFETKGTEGGASDPLVTLLSRQLASGLWDGPGTGSEEVRRARATAQALLELLRAGVTTNHALHGAQVKKAVEALVKLAVKIAVQDTEVAGFALGVAWLVAMGRRTRGEIETLITRHTALSALRPHLSDERTVRSYVERLAPVVAAP